MIGINEQIDSQSGGNEGIGFAVPINTAVSVMQQMQDGSFAPQTQDQTQSAGRVRVPAGPVRRLLAVLSRQPA